MTQKITESQLRDKVAGLREYIAIVEGTQQVSELTAQDVGQGVGQALGGAAGIATAIPRAGAAVGQAVAQNAGNWWDQAKQGVANFAQGVGQGAQQGWAATDPVKMAQAAVGGQGAKPAATKPAAGGGKPDPAVMKLQQELIAKGAKIKADGIMGPATAAAQKQFAAAPAAAPAAAAAPAPSVQATGDDEGNTTITKPDGSTMVVGADGKPYIPGSNPNLPQNQDKRTMAQKILPNALGGQSAPVAPNAQTTSPWQTAQGQSQPATAESVVYQEGLARGYTEEQSLARIIDLARR